MSKTWIGVIAGIIAGAAIAGACIATFANRGGTPEKPKAGKQAVKKTYTLDEGTAIEFLLLNPLHSGDAEVGETATVVVTNDVTSGGKVLVPAGTVAEVEVVRSREASVMSQIVNQPARLEVRFLPIEIEKQSVPLSAQRDEPDATLELTRKTSNKDQASAHLMRLWENPQTKDVLDRLAERLNGESSDDLDDPTSRRIVRDLADQLGLTATSKAISDEKQSVGGLLLATEKAGRGGFDNMNAADTILAFQAVSELAHIANGVDRGLRGKIKGRNIKVPIGTRLTAFTVESVTFVR